MTTKTKSTKITSVKKGDIYETKSGQLIEVTNGRLKTEGEQGSSFEGRTIDFNLETGNPNRSKTTDRFYLDELTKKLSKKDYEEWVEIGRRESEAMADAKEASGDRLQASEKTKTPKSTSKKTPQASRRKSQASMSQLDAAVKVLSEASEPMTTKAMIEAMAAKRYWTSPGGKTPHATLYSALLREIQNKGKDSRFVKVDRGQFGLNK